MTDSETAEIRGQEDFIETAREAEENVNEEIKPAGHTHTHEDGTVHEDHTHTHADGTTHADHAHGHNHGHTHKNTQAVLNRLSRAIGHLEAVKRMVEEGRDCTDVLIQIAAVRSAANNVGKIILQDHIDHCIVEAVEEGDSQALEDLNQAIDKFIK